jgi:hypothetical protein
MTSTRLQRLEHATKDLPLRETRQFESFFLGALSVEVSDIVWDDCLRTTAKFFAKPETTKEVDHAQR